MNALRTRRSRLASRWRLPLVVALIVLALGACQAVVQFFAGGAQGPVFPHAVHAEEGIDCTICHTGAEEGAAAGMPASEKGCMLCHKEIDAEKPEARRVSAFLVDGKPRWLDRPDPYAGEVTFHHGKHFDADVECAACHGPQAAGKGRALHIAGGKKDCLECHANTARGHDCAVCHKVMRQDQPPPSHRGIWSLLHGAHSRVMIEGLGETACQQCHTEQSCTQCHREEKPRSHTNFWRRRGHGLTAAVDRTLCATCHEPDYCARCHRETQPMSHRGSFGPPRNLHCATCHLPARGLGCGVCHFDFPAHVAGPMRPGNAAHMTASSPAGCLACHIALKHPNPGGDCRVCHK